jgi:hypothetical protein
MPPWGAAPSTRQDGVAFSAQPPCTLARRVDTMPKALRSRVRLRAAEGKWVMSSPRRRRSLARTALWICAGPYVVAGSLLAVVFALMVLAVAVQAFAAALRHLL